MKLQICGIRFSGLVDISQPLFSEVAQSLRTYLVGEKLCRYIIFVTNIVEIIYLSINLLLVQKSCGRESLCSKWYFLSTSSIQTVNPSVDEKIMDFVGLLFSCQMFFVLVFVVFGSGQGMNWSIAMYWQNIWPIIDFVSRLDFCTFLVSVCNWTKVEYGGRSIA